MCFDFISHLNCAEWLHYTKSFLTMLFSAIGIYIAYQGLNTWKKQLKGTDIYDLAKKVALHVLESQGLIKSINKNFLEEGSIGDHKYYFQHLNHVKDKLIEKKSEILLYSGQLKIIYNSNIEAELQALYNYIDTFLEYLPYISLKKADHEKLHEGYQFFYETDFADLDAAIDKVIKAIGKIIN
ncbi:hypothetical protein A6J40_12510 [Legionella longbeachae]|uniref:hypothetical protein n=1 Tax=Legionella longbeachae TaxID=450 RepID=UPI0009B76127|nr:hypothetical protein [Legionella longbeachae]ARB92949.1 hypothetical protein A6J40_12510 [Legionella longbeachae]RZV26600.1 hypothetical protein EKG34_05535 [Legionella longbeachae]UAK47159.1 hypothetical protein K8O86_02915 [Legionella longbeachae]